MDDERVKCVVCNHMILPETARRNDGCCALCVRIPLEWRVIKAAVAAEANPLEYALKRYSALLKLLAEEAADRNFGVMADPEFTAVRFYTPERVGQFHTDAMEEVGSGAVDELEHYLLAAAPGYSLLSPMAAELRLMAPSFNAAGRAVFIGSLGMGPAEFGWLIRFLNDRAAFDRYLKEIGITEQEVDAYNEGYAELTKMQQGVGGPPAASPGPA